MCRKANVNDLFKIARLVTKLGIKEELFDSSKGTDDIEKIGFSFIYKVFEKTTTEETQKEVYDVLCSPFCMKSEEVGELPIDDLISKFNECFNVATIVNFIKRATSMKI